MGQEKSLLALTEIKSENKYKLGSKTNTGSALYSNFSLLLILLLLLPTLILLFTLDNPLLFYTMSQHSLINYELLAQQQQK